MASLVVHVHDLNTESAISSPEHTSTPSSSDNRLANAFSPKPKQRSCLCSPTTHKGSFRCRLHRSSSGYWGRKPMPTPPSTPPSTPTPTANGVVHGTDQSVQAQSNIADASCTCGVTSQNPTTGQPLQDGVSSK